MQGLQRDSQPSPKRVDTGELSVYSASIAEGARKSKWATIGLSFTRPVLIQAAAPRLLEHAYEGAVPH
jgi:hypothetical protein